MTVICSTPFATISSMASGSEGVMHSRNARQASWLFLLFACAKMDSKGCRHLLSLDPWAKRIKPLGVEAFMVGFGLLNIADDMERAILSAHDMSNNLF